MPLALRLDAPGLGRASHGLACVEQILGRFGRKSNLPHGRLTSKVSTCRNDWQGSLLEAHPPTQLPALMVCV